MYALMLLGKKGKKAYICAQINNSGVWAKF